jgi:hypothetical protein
MVYFIASDSEVKRSKIFGFTIGRKRSVVTRIAVLFEGGHLMMDVEPDFKPQDLHNYLINLSEKDVWYKDEKSEFPIPARICEYAELSEIPDDYFIQHVIDFSEHIPQSMSPYSDNDKLYLFTKHKDFQVMHFDYLCATRASNMLHNYQLLHRLIDESKAQKV